jgi:hypothetical protein
MSMSSVDLSPPLQKSQAPTPPSVKWRFPALCLLLAIAIGYNVLLGLMAPPPDSSPSLFISLWLVSFLPYLVACILILATRGPTGHGQWRELAIILGGALILRLMLLHIPPDLSRDSWRYLWDARVTLHGYSPYVYEPDNPLFIHLHDFLYDNTRYRSVPTLYPPGAQAFYLLSYLLAPTNLVFFKILLTACEMISCGTLAWLLKKRGSDPARCVIYAWAPLPIIEFAIQGHMDALTIMLMLLTVVCAQSTRRGARALTGVLLALATLTKIYPILLLAAVLRKRDWALLVACAATIALAYLPYVILGQGQVLGFFSTYAGERTTNAGITTQVLNWFAFNMHLSPMLTQMLTYLLDLALLGSAVLIIWWLRLHRRISIEAAVLVLVGAILAASPHIFPWYTTSLLPWIVLCIEPRGTRAEILNPSRLAVGVAWYFSSVSILGYFIANSDDWSLYYLIAYDLSLAGLGLAWLIVILRRYNRG